MADYELWLTDDLGKRFGTLRGETEPLFFSYTRAVAGLATFSIGLPYQKFRNTFNPYFQPDWRMEVWRSPAFGFALRREDVFMLRKPHIYTRNDSVEVIQFYGRNGIDLLNRRSVIQRGGTIWAKKTDQIDDMMKAMVREQMLYGSALDEDGVVDNTRGWPQSEFSVQPDLALGPSVTRNFPDRVVFDVLKELSKSSLQLNEQTSTNKKIYFDVVPKDLSNIASGSPLGWEFQTFAGLRGVDRTGQIEFSPENENIRAPAYSISHLDEVNSVIVRGNGSGKSQLVTSVEDSARLLSSRWNRSEKVLSASSETTVAALQDAGRAELRNGKPEEELFVTFLNSPGSQTVPRSLYGVDWDLGDLVKINYAGKQLEAEIKIVYVSVDEQGKEDITGRNEIQTT